jgi:hypothetical protein
VIQHTATSMQHSSQAAPILWLVRGWCRHWILLSYLGHPRAPDCLQGQAIVCGWCHLKKNAFKE